MLKLNDEFALRKIAGETVVLPVAGEALRENAIYAANGVGLDILSYLRQPRTEQELIDCLCAEYDTQGQDVSDDVRSYLEELLAARIVVEVP